MVRVGRVGINDVRPIMTLTLSLTLTLTLALISNSMFNSIYSLTPSPDPPGISGPRFNSFECLSSRAHV